MVSLDLKLLQFLIVWFTYRRLKALIVTPCIIKSKVNNSKTTAHYFDMFKTYLIRIAILNVFRNATFLFTNYYAILIFNELHFWHAVCFIVSEFNFKTP
jgi:hypothetical protein